MKKIWVLLFLFPLGVTAQIQLLNKENHPTLNLSVGSAVPLKSFGSNKSNNDGFTTSGVNLNAFGYFHIYQEFNITASVYYSNLPVDNEAIISVLKEANPAEYSVNTSNWSELALMVGPSYCYVNKHFSADLKFQIGIVSNTSASLNIHNNTTGKFISTPEVNSSSFMYGPGLTLRTAVTEKLYLIGNFDYLNTDAVFYGDLASSSNGYYLPVFENKITFINVSVGIAFILK